MKLVLLDRSARGSLEVAWIARHSEGRMLGCLTCLTAISPRDALHRWTLNVNVQYTQCPRTEYWCDNQTGTGRPSIRKTCLNLRWMSRPNLQVWQMFNKYRRFGLCPEVICFFSTNSWILLCRKERRFSLFIQCVSLSDIADFERGLFESWKPLRNFKLRIRSIRIFIT